MTNNQLTDHKLTKIIESAEAVISALAGYNDDAHPDDSTKMCRLWDALNDDDATPEVVLVMSKELQERRKADSEPAMYVMGMGRALDAETASTCKSAVDSWVGEWNQSRLPGQADYKTVPLYRHAQSAPERDQVRSEHAEWSQATFGNVGPVGPLKHLSKEALEAAAEPGDLSEWADMQFLLWDAQRRAGITDEQITQAMIEKLAVNKQREWPEPKDGEPRLHIKAQPALVVLKDHQIRELVNQLRDIAIEYHGTQQLRERIARVLRAAMLQAEPVTTANKLGNSPVIPEGLVGCGENCWSCGKYFTYEQHSECDGYCPHCNSPVDLDDEEDQPSKVVPTNPTEEMISNAWREAIGKCDHETIKRIYATMLAAAPQEVKGE